MGLISGQSTPVAHQEKPALWHSRCVSSSLPIRRVDGSAEKHLRRAGLMVAMGAAGRAVLRLRFNRVPTWKHSRFLGRVVRRRWWNRALHLLARLRGLPRGQQRRTRGAHGSHLRDTVSALPIRRVVACRDFPNFRDQRRSVRFELCSQRRSVAAELQLCAVGNHLRSALLCHRRLQVRHGVRKLGGGSESSVGLKPEWLGERFLFKVSALPIRCVDESAR